MVAGTKQDIALMAHLLRRSSFGASYDELTAHAAKGYEATVEELLYPENQPAIEEDLMLRLNTSWQPLPALENVQSYWFFKMINTKRPLEEKIALFWHSILCTGYTKIHISTPMHVTVDMFRRQGLGSFRNLLVDLARDPGMIYMLDNFSNHKGAINENWGRELLELFSMGVGNYTEGDIKEASRAFTGWTIHPCMPVYPNGLVQWEFCFDPTDHDDGEKTFLGRVGRFNGEDIIDIICQQPSTASFISRHLYNFFVADEVPVPQWHKTPPRDPQAIETLSQAYFDYNYDIRSMLRVLFNSDFFKNAPFARVKSPTELVAGTLRMVKTYPIWKLGFFDEVEVCEFMGQQLLNPPTVEGWHTGKEWVETGALVERVNFLTEQLGDITKPGVREMVERIRAKGESLSAEVFIDGCLEQLGAISLRDDTRRVLLERVKSEGPIKTRTEEFERRTVEMFRLIVGTAKEYQLT